MHIAIFTDYYLPTLGGVQTSIKAQKEALEKAGHHVTLFCPLHKASDHPDIVRLPTSHLFKPDGYPFAWSPKKVIAMAQKALTNLGDVDIIHVHTEMVAAFAGLIVGRLVGIPIVQSMHGRLDVYANKVLPVPWLSTVILEQFHNHYIKHDSALSLVKTNYTRTAHARRMWRCMVNQANFADHVIVPSAHFAKKLQEQGVSKPLTVLSNGLEDSVLRALRANKPRTYQPTETLRVMWCSRVSPEKRPLAFLTAVHLFPARVSVDMYGDGVAFKSVRQFIEHHQLGDKVTLHGSVPQETILKAMLQHHILVSSSYDFDNQPMVLLEAIAAGLPVVYCDPDLSEVVPRGGSILLDSPTAEHIARAIRYLQGNPHTIQRMSSAMIAAQSKTAQKRYTKKLLEIYKIYTK